MRVGRTALLVISGLHLAGCGSGGGAGSAAESARSATPFVDVTAASKIAYQVGYTRPSFIRRDMSGLLTFQVLYMTIGGAAAGDCDNDGDIDLFITYGNTGGPNGGGGPNRLYLNQLVEHGNGLCSRTMPRKPASRTRVPTASQRSAQRARVRGHGWRRRSRFVRRRSTRRPEQDLRKSRATAGSWTLRRIRRASFRWLPRIRFRRRSATTISTATSTCSSRTGARSTSLYGESAHRSDRSSVEKRVRLLGHPLRERQRANWNLEADRG